MEFIMRFVLSVLTCFHALKYIQFKHVHIPEISQSDMWTHAGKWWGILCLNGLLIRQESGPEIYLLHQKHPMEIYLLQRSYHED